MNIGIAGVGGSSGSINFDSDAAEMANDFEGKIALVTGAGSGIGREAARAFARRGAIVYCADVNDGGFAETQSLITDDRQ